MKNKLHKKTHQYHLIEVVNEYRNNQPTKILAAHCPECGEFFLDLMGLLQEREDEGFRLRGNSEVSIINSDWDYARQRKYYHPQELKDKL